MTGNEMSNFFVGIAPSPGNTTNHNHATTVTSGTVVGSGGSNFKRQNTVDAATIKENSARVAASRPSAPKNNPGQLDTSEFPFCFKLLSFYTRESFVSYSLVVKVCYRLFFLVSVFVFKNLSLGKKNSLSIL